MWDCSRLRIELRWRYDGGAGSQVSIAGRAVPCGRGRVPVQAKFNWSRVQYLLAFNAAILAAAVGLTPPAGGYTVVLYGLGIVAASLTLFAVRTQHDYYRAARDRMRRVEAEFGISETVRVDTTSTLGGRKRVASVNQVVTLLLGALVVAHIVGAALALAT